MSSARIARRSRPGGRASTTTCGARLTTQHYLLREWSRHSDLNRGPAVYESEGTGSTCLLGSPPMGCRDPGSANRVPRMVWCRETWAGRPRETGDRVARPRDRPGGWVLYERAGVRRRGQRRGQPRACVIRGQPRSVNQLSWSMVVQCMACMRHLAAGAAAAVGTVDGAEVFSSLQVVGRREPVTSSLQRPERSSSPLPTARGAPEAGRSSGRSCPRACVAMQGHRRPTDPSPR
jgi:hypothetical protein